MNNHCSVYSVTAALFLDEAKKAMLYLFSASHIAVGGRKSGLPSGII